MSCPVDDFDRARNHPVGKSPGASVRRLRWPVSQRLANTIRAAFRGVMLIGILLNAGCYAIPRGPSKSDEELADAVYKRIAGARIRGVSEFQASADGGHVTIGGRVDSVETLKQVVAAIGFTPGLRELSFYGMEFDTAEIADEEILAEMRRSVEAAIGPDLAKQLGYFCEDHFAIVFGRLPSFAVREQVEEAVRVVPGIGRYFVAAEIVLADPPSDDAVVQSVERKFRNLFDIYNLTFRAGDIRVESNKNVVTLTGRASSVAGRLGAEMQAKRALGVRYVINRIEVPGEPPAPLDAPAVRVPNGSPPETGPQNGPTKL